jgi:hypothetical protein
MTETKTNRVSEADLDRIRELAKAKPGDALAQREWIARARHELLLLVDDLTDRQAASGGEFATRLREALEAKVLEQVGERAALTNQTEIHSLSVHLTAQAAWVDVRLRLGVGQ